MLNCFLKLIILMTPVTMFGDMLTVMVVNMAFLVLSRVFQLLILLTHQIQNKLTFINQQRSTWRDIKTWGDYAYVTSDQGGTTDGLLIIDMANLPDSISYRNYNMAIPGEGVINTCHNLYIDESGFYI